MDITLDDDSEEISISLRALPPVEAFVRALETAGLWTQVMHCAWQPWFAAARGFTRPWAMESPPPSDGASRSAEERSSPDRRRTIWRN
jgi:hypothetical protein